MSMDNIDTNTYILRHCERLRTPCIKYGNADAHEDLES